MPSEPLTRPGPRALLGALLTAALAAPASAGGLRLPEWGRVEVELAAPLELGRATTVKVRLVAGLGELRAAAPSLLGNADVVERGKPEPAGGLVARPGAPAEWSLRLRVSAAGAEPRIQVRIPVRLPREALLAEIDRRYRALDRRAAEALAEEVRALPADQTLSGFLVPAARLEEGATPGRSPALTRYLQLSGARLALWEPPRPAAGPAARQAAATGSPRLRSLLAAAGVAPPDGPRDSYRQMLDALAAGQTPDCQALPELDAEDPLLGFGLENLRAACWWASGRSQLAFRLWSSLETQPAHGYYAAYNRGVALAAAGERRKAAAALRESLRRRPVFSLARQRLRQLEEPKEDR